jgi:hypothetical protein
MESGRSIFKILTGKRHLGRHRYIWEDNVGGVAALPSGTSPGGG